MSVLSQARGTLTAIAEKFKRRAGATIQVDTDIKAAVSSVNTAEGKTKKAAGVMRRMADDSQTDLGAISQIVASTQTNDRSNAVSLAAAAQKKAKEAAEALAGLEEPYKVMRQAIINANGKVTEAKNAQARADSAIRAMASSL